LFPSDSISGKSNITVGTDIETALNNSARRVRGHISAGGQYHFYMEAQTAVACSVDGDNITVTCGSQYASAYQSTIAMVLGVPLNKVQSALSNHIFLLCCSPNRNGCMFCLMKLLVIRT
jgi:xanthine dehydrogenase molybdopterin-binding subunit B